VVISIIGVLAGLLLPALARAKDKARSTNCISNLKQLGIATVMYADDNNDRLPGCAHSEALPSWVGTLRAYASTNVYRCPGDKVPPPRLDNLDKPTRFYSFAINDFLAPKPLGAPHLNLSVRSSIRSPGETVWMGETGTDEEMHNLDHFHFADSRDNGYRPREFSHQVDVMRHGRTANYLFVDSHVSSVRWKPNVEKLLTEEGSTFIYPLGHTNSP